MQKFHMGDLVHIAQDLGPMMTHFVSDQDAIVLGSYADQYGDPRSVQGEPVYTLFLKDRGETSWYYESQLHLLENNRRDLLRQWREELERDRAMKADLDWIFGHGKEVLEHGYGASMQTLASCFGCTNLWGSRGEGYVYFTRAMATREMAAPYLRNGDKAGWLAHCEKIKEGATPC
jgi:hypothetical protein